MDQIKDILTIIANYFIEIFKHFEMFPEEFFELIEGAFPKEAE